SVGGDFLGRRAGLSVREDQVGHALLESTHVATVLDGLLAVPRQRQAVLLDGVGLVQSLACQPLLLLGAGAGVLGLVAVLLVPGIVAVAAGHSSEDVCLPRISAVLGRLLPQLAVLLAEFPHLVSGLLCGVPHVDELLLNRVARSLEVVEVVESVLEGAGEPLHNLLEDAALVLGVRNLLAQLLGLVSRALLLVSLLLSLVLGTLGFPSKTLLLSSSARSLNGLEPRSPLLSEAASSVLTL